MTALSELDAMERRPRRSIRHRIMPYALLAPALIVTFVVVFMPMLEAVVTSLYELVLFRPNASRFVGLGNYVALFGDPVFWTALWQTCIWIGLTVPLQMGLGPVSYTHLTLPTKA